MKEKFVPTQEVRGPANYLCIKAVFKPNSQLYIHLICTYQMRELEDLEHIMASSSVFIAQVTLLAYSEHKRFEIPIRRALLDLEQFCPILWNYTSLWRRSLDTDVRSKEKSI